MLLSHELVANLWPGREFDPQGLAEFADSLCAYAEELHELAGRLSALLPRDCGQCGCRAEAPEWVTASCPCSCHGSES